MKRIALIVVAVVPGVVVAQQTSGFRQGVDYRIEARLDEATQTLRARARLRYTNNSPNRLDMLYVHQHLNAFRPNSAWARRELEFDIRRFQDLGPDDHAFERFVRITVDGAAVQAVYPGAPDSTVAGIPLPRPLRPGASVDVVMDWDARPSTTPRRQGRQGRHYDFAQWYPRIAVYDTGGWQTQPLLPQGEFFGEFASYDVTLDVAADQVMGATGVPVAGDPGWQAAPGAAPGELFFRRGVYAERPVPALGFLDASPAAGRKRVRWRAEDVHHFAWSADPAFRHEGGRLRDIAVHVLFRDGSLEWDLGVVVQRAIRSLAWLESIFGRYPYPQLTILERIENGGTEFPMLVMNGGSSQGLVMHEVAHQYAHGIFASNEWRDAWLDEGFASFLSSWFVEQHGNDGVWRSSLEQATRTPQELLATPVATPAADFPTFPAYNAMSYGKGSIVFYMLRELIGEEAFRRGLRTYYERHRLSHVTEHDLRRSLEAAAGTDLGWFFEQWLHRTAALDFAVDSVTAERGRDGRWRVRFAVTREGDAWMPVTVRVGAETRRLEGREPRQVVEIVTTDQPAEVVVDPDYQVLETDKNNNRKAVM